MQVAHVIGAGGIGVALGWALARAGSSVTMVEASAEKVRAGRHDGLSVDGVSQRDVRFELFDDWTPPAGAILLLCTKTYDNAAALARMPERRLLIPVQNGFDPALEASGHPFEGIASFVSQCEPGRPATRITRDGELYLGGRRALTPAERDTIRALAGTLRQGGLRRVKLVETTNPYKWSKLMYNAAISPLAASAGIDNGELLGDPLARRLFFALLRENYSILHRIGVPLARIGPFHPRVVNRILRAPGLAGLLARGFRPGLKGTYCSMVPDMGTGRTEIAAYNGYLISLAQGVGCPINSAVVAMMNSMNAQPRPPRRARLVELEATLAVGGLD